MAVTQGRLKRFPSIDTLKGIAIMMVVVIHTGPFLATSSGNGEWYSLVGNCLQQLSSFAVPFFFVVAGYFFSREVEQETVFQRWWKYTSRLSLLLLFWTIFDGILWGQWLEQIIKSRSLSPLLWNLSAIPSFAMKRPELFLFRGTSVPLWFLISLIIAISILSIFIRFSLNGVALFLIAFGSYTSALAVSSYSSTILGLGLQLPLEQRGPLIAFAFVAIGHLLARHHVPIKHSGFILAAVLLLLFAEAALLSQFLGTPFQERPYLFSTLVLAASGLLFGLNHLSFGANSLVSRIGNRSLGIYLVHTSVIGGFGGTRGLFTNPIWEIFFPVLILATSYLLVFFLLKIPYIRLSVQ